MKTIIIFISVLFVSLNLSATVQDTVNWQIAPNPFVTQTTIQFDLTEQDTVSIFVYNQLGQTVSTILNLQVLAQGNYSYIFHGDSVPDGLYIVRLKINQNSYAKHIAKNSLANIDNTKNTDNNNIVVYSDKDNMLKINGKINTGDLITIYSIDGKIIGQYFCKQNNFESIDLSNIVSQILIVKITNNEMKLNYTKMIMK